MGPPHHHDGRPSWTARRRGTCSTSSVAGRMNGGLVWPRPKPRRRARRAVRRPWVARSSDEVYEVLHDVAGGARPARARRVARHLLDFEGRSRRPCSPPPTGGSATASIRSSPVVGLHPRRSPVAAGHRRAARLSTSPDSLEALGAAERCINSAPLLPGEDGTLLPGPDGSPSRPSFPISKGHSMTNTLPGGFPPALPDRPEAATSVTFTCASGGAARGDRHLRGARRHDRRRRRTAESSVR